MLTIVEEKGMSIRNNFKKEKWVKYIYIIEPFRDLRRDLQRETLDSSKKYDVCQVWKQSLI